MTFGAEGGIRVKFVVRGSSLVCRPSSVLRLPLSFVLRSSLLPPKSRSAKKWFKNGTFWYIFAQNTRIFDKKVQKSAKTRSFLPSFLAQNQISPIKSPFLPPPTAPFFKISLKNPIFLKNYLKKIMKPIESNWFFQQLAD